VVERAKGEAARFTALVAEYERAPLITRKRLYLDAMESVFGSTSKILVDTKGGNPMMYLPMDQLIRPQGAAPSEAAPRPPGAPPAPAVPPPADEYRSRGR
jgi:membrane protease subunit HflK